MPKSSEAETIAFLASVDVRNAALADVVPSCPFDPMGVAESFVEKMQSATSISQIVHTYAAAMLAVDPGARKAWEKVNDEVNAITWPYGLAYIQKMAADINRKAGNMPASRVE